MWIRPNPEDPTTRFVDLMNGTVMKEIEYTLRQRIVLYCHIKRISTSQMDFTNKRRLFLQSSH